MKLYHRYLLDFKGKWLNWSVLAMALSLFANMVYYFGFCNFLDIGFFPVVFGAIFPAVLSAGYIVLIKIRRLNAPGIYGIIATALCLCAFVCNFFTANAPQIILGSIFYLLAGVITLMGVGGFLPGRLPIKIVFFIGFAGKLLFFTRSIISGGFIRDLGLLFFYGAVFFLPYALKDMKKRK